MEHISLQDMITAGIAHTKTGVHGEDSASTDTGNLLTGRMEK